MGLFSPPSSQQASVIAKGLFRGQVWIFCSLYDFMTSPLASSQTALSCSLKTFLTTLCVAQTMHDFQYLLQNCQCVSIWSNLERNSKAKMIQHQGLSTTSESALPAVCHRHFSPVETKDKNQQEGRVGCIFTAESALPFSNYSKKQVMHCSKCITWICRLSWLSCGNCLSCNRRNNFNHLLREVRGRRIRG